MKVLHVIPSLDATEGGPSVAVKAMAETLVSEGVKVTIATTTASREQRIKTTDYGLLTTTAECTERDGDYKVIYFRRNFGPYKVSFGLAKWLSRNVTKFDLIHIHALFSFSSTMAARIARKQNVPYIVRPLGVLNRWGMENRRRFLKLLSFRYVELPLLLKSAAIHYTSEAERMEAGELNEKLARHSSLVIPLPVEAVVKGDAEALRVRYPRLRGPKIILFLSRIDPKKGIELLLEAFAVVKRNEPNSLLVIAGDGESKYIDSLRAQAVELDISSNILWTGFLNPRDKASAYAAASVFVLPSRSENFGIAAAEALAAGVPCVLSDRVALSDYLQNNDSALIVPCEASAIANALCELLSKPEMRARLAERGRQAAAERFSPQSVGESLVIEYNKISVPSRRDK